MGRRDVCVRCVLVPVCDISYLFFNSDCIQLLYFYSNIWIVLSKVNERVRGETVNLVTFAFSSILKGRILESI